MHFLKKIKNYFNIFFHSIFWGMKGADKEILSSKSPSTTKGVQAEETLEKHNVYSDFLQEKETEEVKETRDAMYRVYKESDNYNVELFLQGFNRENDEEEIDEHVKVSARAVKKESFFDEKYPPIIERDGKLILIQDQIIYDLDSKDRDIEMAGGKVRNKTLITATYKDFVPNFIISDYVKRIVVWKNNSEVSIDLYFNEKQGHLNTRDALFINELFRKMKNKEYKSTAFDMDKIEFVTHKAKKQDDFKKYEFSHFALKSIKLFDGSYVVNLGCSPDIFGKDIVEKYKTDSLTTKYKNKAPKSKTINLEMAEKISQNKA